MVALVVVASAVAGAVVLVMVSVVGVGEGGSIVVVIVVDVAVPVAIANGVVVVVIADVVATVVATSSHTRCPSTHLQRLAPFTIHSDVMACALSSSALNTIAGCLVNLFATVHLGSMPQRYSSQQSPGMPLARRASNKT